MNQLVLKPTYWASVSGGKDSLFMLNLILNNLDKYPLDGVIHFELEIDYPFIKDVINYMEDRCKSFGIPFVRIKPRVSWYDLYDKFKFPTRKARWCNKYKLDAKLQFDQFKKEQGYNTIYYIGYCVDEFKRYDKRKDLHEIYPLVIENIEESFILQWAKDVPIFNDYYKYNDRCGCMFCPLQSMKNTLYLRRFYPDEYFKMMDMCLDTEIYRSNELGKSFSVWQSNSKYDTKYRMNKIEDLYKSGYFPSSEYQTKLF